MPGRSNVCVNAAPGSMLPESHEPSSAVTVCGLRPSFVHSIDCPGWIRTTSGSKMLSIVLTVAP